MHSGWVVSQKDVAWLVWRSQSVLFVRRRAQTALFRHAAVEERLQSALLVTPAVEERLQSALFREAQRAECAFP